MYYCIYAVSSITLFSFLLYCFCFSLFKVMVIINAQLCKRPINQKKLYTSMIHLFIGDFVKCTMSNAFVIFQWIKRIELNWNWIDIKHLQIILWGYIKFTSFSQRPPSHNFFITTSFSQHLSNNVFLTTFFLQMKNYPAFIISLMKRKLKLVVMPLSNGWIRVF